MSYLLAQASAHRIPLRDESVQCVVTSPPYWGLRAYAGEQAFAWGGEEHAHGAWRGALGLEPTPELYVAHMVEVFREVRRVLRKDGTLWLNLGDSYASTGGHTREGNTSQRLGRGNLDEQNRGYYSSIVPGLKPKDLVGIPWRVAFALQADGWYLRAPIIWHKPNPMPGSQRDRPTIDYEYVFLLAKSERYYYDDEAIREEAIHEGRIVKASGAQAKNAIAGDDTNDRRTAAGFTTHDTLVAGRTARAVWTIATQPYPGAHFATFPEALPERCIKAGSAAQACSVCGAPWVRVTDVESRPNAPSLTGKYDGNGARMRTALGFEPTCAHDAPTVGSVVLDLFNGSGTTGRVALRLGRRYVGIDVSREYLSEQALRRIDPITAQAQDFRRGIHGSQGTLL